MSDQKQDACREVLERLDHIETALKGYALEHERVSEGNDAPGYSVRVWGSDRANLVAALNSDLPLVRRYLREATSEQPDTAISNSLKQAMLKAMDEYRLFAHTPAHVRVFAAEILSGVATKQQAAAQPDPAEVVERVQRLIGEFSDELPGASYGRHVLFSHRLVLARRIVTALSALPQADSGPDRAEGLAEDLHQLIRVALTNPGDLSGFIEANYPAEYGRYAAQKAAEEKL